MPDRKPEKKQGFLYRHWIDVNIFRKKFLKNENSGKGLQDMVILQRNKKLMAIY
jgi:hypothetical protein